MTSTIRRRIAFVGAMVIAATSVSDIAGAQDSGGGWGAEGRAGSGTQAYLVRRFNSNWSALLGGNGDISSNKRDEPSGFENTNRSVNVALLLRRYFGTGAMQPFLGFGPTAGINRAKSTQTGGGSGTTTGETNVNTVGGRGEFGGMMSVTQKLSFGLAATLNVNSGSTTSTVSNSNIESKTTNTQVNFGNLQFIGHIKF